MTSSDLTPALQETLEELKTEVRRNRYLFSVSIIVLALVLTFVTPVVIRSSLEYSASDDTGMSNPDHPDSMYGKTTAPSAASSTPTASTTPKE